MSKTIEFYLDIGSPTTYLALRRLHGLIERYDAKLDYKPVALGAIFKAIENRLPTVIPAKEKWFRRDVERSAKRHGIEFNWNPYFPIGTMYLMRVATGLQGTPEFEPFLRAAFSGTWVDRLNMTDDQICDEQMRRYGLEPEKLRALAARDETKLKLRENTQNAINRGVFGCPTMIVGSELTFGQDRMIDVEEFITGSPNTIEEAVFTPTTWQKRL